jgi:hypothetical protein
MMKRFQPPIATHADRAVQMPFGAPKAFDDVRVSHKLTGAIYDEIPEPHGFEVTVMLERAGHVQRFETRFTEH